MELRSECALRAPREEDWPAIAALADVAVAAVPGAPRQHEWVAHRRAFRGERVHVVAELDQKVAGYAALERGPGDPEATYRIFLVTSWSHTPAVADLLYEEIEAELRRRGARRAWLREYAADAQFGAFVRARGFEVRERYERDGLELVTFEKAC